MRIVDFYNDNGIPLMSAFDEYSSFVSVVTNKFDISDIDHIIIEADMILQINTDISTAVSYDNGDSWSNVELDTPIELSEYDSLIVSFNLFSTDTFKTPKLNGYSLTLFSLWGLTDDEPPTPITPSIEARFDTKMIMEHLANCEDENCSIPMYIELPEPGKVTIGDIKFEFYRLSKLPDIQPISIEIVELEIWGELKL